MADFLELLKQVFVLFGALAVLGVIVILISFYVFKFIGKQWIENKFSTSLEEAKSEINFLLMTKNRLHEKEYEVFPDVWQKLIEAKTSLEQCVRSFRSSPDFVRLNSEEFESFLAQSDLSNKEKEILKASEPNMRFKEYIRILEWRDIVDSNSKFIEFDDYLQKVRIFLEPSIKKKFDAISQALWNTWVSKQLSFEDSKSFKASDAHKSFREEVKPLMDEIEMIIQTKLFPAQR